MAATLPAFGDCCLPCESPVTVSVPGPQGPAGADGADGATGTSSYTLLTAQFIMPAVDGTVTVAVEDSRGFFVGQFIAVQFAGTMEVTAKPDTTHLTLKNNAIFGSNVAAGAVIGVGAIVGPPVTPTPLPTILNPTTGTYYELSITGAAGEEILGWAEV